MQKRAFSLDAFRGYAILTMILSGTIVNRVLPAWMSHAQVGPRSGFTFDPSIYGITWVDLVFPFFLFAMGAAFPFSLGGKYRKGASRLRLAIESVERGVKLTFFAIFIQHMYPWVTASPETPASRWLALGAFALMFPMFMRLPAKISKGWRAAIRAAAYGGGIALLLTVTYADGRSFSLSYSNIIILVLADMAVFGSLAYLFTIGNRWARIGILPFIMAVFLGSSTDGSWVKALMNFSPVPWMYQFFYLKYLFIVIPGSIAGGYLYEWMEQRSVPDVRTTHDRLAGEPVRNRRHDVRAAAIFLLSVSLIAWNLYGLYMRYLLLNLGVTIALLVALYSLLRRTDCNTVYWKKLFTAGAYLLMLGLFFEAYEGGIRKDPSTYSYYFVSSGLAFLALIAFSIACDLYRFPLLTRPLELAGQNPMIAYVAPQLFIMPILNLVGLSDVLAWFTQNAWLGFLRGVLVTGLAVSVAVVCSRLKIFWRT